MDIIDHITERSHLPASLYYYVQPGDLLTMVRDKTILAPDIRYANENFENDYTAEVVADLIAEKLNAASAGNSRPAAAKKEQPASPKAANRRKNDPRVVQLLDEIMDRVSSLEHYHLFACTFHQEGDQASHWRSYCPEGGGYSLGLDSTILSRRVSAQGFQLVKCIPDESEQRQLIGRLLDDAVRTILTVPPDHEDWLLELNNTTDQFILQCIRLTAVFQHPSFYTGAEWRCFSMPFPVLQTDASLVFTNGNGVLVPSIAIDLSEAAEQAFPVGEAVVGPTRQMSLSAHALELFLNTHGITSCQVRLSDVPYKKW